MNTMAEWQKMIAEERQNTQAAKKKGSVRQKLQDYKLQLQSQQPKPKPTTGAEQEHIIDILND